MRGAACLNIANGNGLCCRRERTADPATENRRGILQANDAGVSQPQRIPEKAAVQDPVHQTLENHFVGVFRHDAGGCRDGAVRRKYSAGKLCRELICSGFSEIGRGGALAVLGFHWSNINRKARGTRPAAWGDATAREPVQDPSEVEPRLFEGREGAELQSEPTAACLAGGQAGVRKHF